MSDFPLVCDLTVFTTQQRADHEALCDALFASVTEVRELPDGYQFRLPAESETLFMLAAFIRDERLCCPFWAFGVQVEPPGGAIWLHLTGPEGVKPMVLPDLISRLSASVAAAGGLQ